MRRLACAALLSVALAPLALQAQVAKENKAPTRGVYLIGDLLESPELWAKRGRLEDGPPAQLLVQLIVSNVGLTQAEIDGIQLLNGSSLVVVAAPARHQMVGDLIAALRRLIDVTATVQAQLFEVDAAFYAKLKKEKRLSVDEAEQRFLAGEPESPLFNLIAKQKPVLTGTNIALDNRRAGVLLSHQRIARCLPAPAQAQLGDRAPQVIVTGTSFLVSGHVGADRRYVRLKVTEKAVDVQDVRKREVFGPDQKLVVAEEPLLRETSHSEVVDVADGGSALVAVHVRPAAQDRYWVLLLTARIRILEEERQVSDKQ